MRDDRFIQSKAVREELEIMRQRGETDVALVKNRKKSSRLIRRVKICINKRLR